MRFVNEIIWHCSATKEGQDVSMETIKLWHTKQRGWNDIGYHYVIELSGKVREGRPLWRPGAHVSGRNANSVGVCYVGGCDANMKPKDTRTKKQKDALYKLTEKLIAQFPDATVHGHNEFSAKACPSFNAKEDWEKYLASKVKKDDPIPE